MKITRDNLRAAYEYLSETEPFVGWNLPNADDIKFDIVNAVKRAGRCVHKFSDDYAVSKFNIEVSNKHVDTTNYLMETMAHEMVHLHMFHNHVHELDHHGKAFQSYAKKVCKIHGFDLVQF